jgi:hypothetical protein
MLRTCNLSHDGFDWRVNQIEHYQCA